MVNTLPLFQNPSIPSAWHNVTAPGGYEWWYFSAEDVENDRQIVAILFDGCAFHPGYLRRYFAYAKHPTRVAPPRASDFACAYFAVSHAGKVEHQVMTQYPAEQFEARRDTRHVQIGPNRFTAEDGALKLWLGGTPWRRTAQGPKVITNSQLTATLSFRPRFAHTPNERELFSRQLTGAAHRWVIANPSCDCEGEIQISGRTVGAARSIPFRGLGYHDHNFGTGPLAAGIKQWFRGRLLLDDRCITFHFAQPRDARVDPELHLIEIDASGARDVAPDVSSVEIEFSQKAAAWLRYPSQARFGEVLTLTNPRVIDSSPFHLRLMYDATLRGKHAGRAICEVAYLNRLRAPILGRMIEMAIDRRAMVDSSR